MVVDFQGMANWVQVLIETSIAGIRKTLIQPTSSASAPSTFMRVPLIVARSCRSLGLVWGMLMVLPERYFSPSIMIVYRAFVVIIDVIIAIWRGKFSTGLRRFLTFLHELDNSAGRAHLGEDHDDQTHDIATQLLVDQVKRKHAVDESSCKEHEAEEDRDRQDSDIKSFHLSGYGRLEVYRVRNSRLKLTAIFEDGYAKDEEWYAGKGTNPLVESVSITLSDLLVIYQSQTQGVMRLIINNL